MILAHVPVTFCNLKCSYCYISQGDNWRNEPARFPYSADHIAKALSRERMGGPCYINLCGGGETLIPPEIIDITRKLLEQGHYCEIVTNGLLTKRFEQLSQFPQELLSRLLFKFSYHYEELLRLSKFDEFFANVRRMRDCGCSFTAELMTYDELIPHLPAAKKICEDNLGAPPILTVGRQNVSKGIPILSDYSKQELREIYKDFNSQMFDFKLSTFDIKRREFCYAGEWLLAVNLGDAYAGQCYKSCFRQNIFDDPERPIKWRTIGHFCRQPHCYNSHMLLTMGLIPELTTPTYAEMKNRKTKDGTEWLKENVKYFYSSKLNESNKEYSRTKKVINTITTPLVMMGQLFARVKRKLKSFKT